MFIIQRKSFCDLQAFVSERQQHRNWHRCEKQGRVWRSQTDLRHAIKDESAAEIDFAPLLENQSLHYSFKKGSFGLDWCVWKPFRSDKNAKIWWQFSPAWCCYLPQHAKASGYAVPVPLGHLNKENKGSHDLLTPRNASFNIAWYSTRR